jgi:dTDP-3-amino-3,4,6-trideoxy-alpha-D-glucose transaminase
MEVPFLDVHAGVRELRSELDDALTRVMDSGCYVLGPEVEAFEHEFAAACSVRHAVGVGNGLDALSLALRALDVGPGAEVVVPAHTFIASWLAVTAVGATPVPVEPDPHTLTLDRDRIADAIGPRTAAIMVVHLYGHPVDVEPLRAFGLPIVEDAAQAHGATRDGRPVGSLGTIAAFSFYPGKNLGAYGDGGAVTTDDAGLANRVRALRNYGSRRRYEHDRYGVNSRLDPLQAAMLRAKLPHLAAWNMRRADHAARYRAALAGLPGLVLPPDPADACHAWHLFVVRTPARDALGAHMAASGVSTLVHYPIPPHRAGPYPAAGWQLPLTDQICDEVLSLPIGPHLSTIEQDHVIAAVQTFHQEATCLAA